MRLRLVGELVLLMLYLYLALFVYVKLYGNEPACETVSSRDEKSQPSPAPSILPTLPRHVFQHFNSSNRDRYPPRAIALVTGYFRPPRDHVTSYDRLFQMHVDRTTRYAHMHSYAYFLENSHWQTVDFQKAVWSKLPAIWSHLPRYEWIMWVDADAMISNFEISIDQILHQANQQFDIENPDARKDFLVAKDMNGLNFGVFLLRNSTWSVDFLKRAYDMMNQRTIREEQHAVQWLLQLHPEDQAKTQYIPQRWINSYPQEVLLIYNLPLKKVEAARFQEGDFILHTPGLAVKDKLQCFESTLSPHLPDINVAPGQSIHWDLAIRPFGLE